MSDEMREIIIRGLMASVDDMLIKFLRTLPLGLLIGIITYVILSHCRTGLYAKRKYVSIFNAYISIIIQMTIVFRPIGQIFVIDLTPFQLYGGARYTILYASANAIIFIPFGFLLPIVWRKAVKWHICVGMGFLFSFFIELSQLLLRCGNCQVEDLIMNTIGTFIGYEIYKRIKEKI